MVVEKVRDIVLIMDNKNKVHLADNEDFNEAQFNYDEKDCIVSEYVKDLYEEVSNKANRINKKVFSYFKIL